MSNERWVFHVLGLFLLVLLAAALVWGALTGRLTGIASSVGAGAAAAQPVLWTGLAPPIDVATAESAAYTKAQSWAPDVVLIRIEATWRPTGEWVTTDSPPVSWTYYYYAASRGAVKSISVRGEQLFDTPETEVPNQPRSLATFPPISSVDAAWLTFRAAGGDEFLETNTNAAVQMQLRATAEGDRWVISAYNPTANMRVTIDAATGLLVNP